MQNVDVAIIGGGIVGLATAYHLTNQFPHRSVLILEKESALAQHQTGHNSGVLHSGIYYRPGSLKALNCRTGKKAMEAFCRDQGIDYDICGKVIVAVNEQELPMLELIHQRGQQNDVPCEMIGRQRLEELEPHTAGIKAIHVPEAGIVNYRQASDRMGQIIQERGGQIITGARVTAMRRGEAKVVLISSAGEFTARYVVNCAGLHSDRVARLSGQRADALIVPFRGEFYQLKPEARHLCNNLIYPVPNPDFPFLGVHFTRTIDGHIECGPNAVLAFAREGYRKWDVNLRDLVESLTYRGFLRLVLRNWRTGLGELQRSFSKAAFVRALQRLVPSIRAEHLEAAPSGVRAQAIAPDGSMVDDFLIHDTHRVVNVCNAPSPAATSSLNIGKIIVEKLAMQFD